MSVVQLGSWDDALQAVADVLTDIHLTPEERDQFRSVVQMISARWRGGPQLAPQLATVANTKGIGGR